MFDDNNLIETDPLNPPNNWFGCDDIGVSENVVPTTNSGNYAFKVEVVVERVTMYQVT